MTKSMRTNQTSSGYQSYNAKGRKEHTWAWIPEEYGFLARDGEPATGSFCLNCGKWNGSPLARGELTRMRRAYRTSDRRERQD